MYISFPDGSDCEESTCNAGDLDLIPGLVSLVAQTINNLPAMQETWEDPWRRKWQPTPVFLPEKSHGRKSLAGHSPSGLKDSDTTEQH